MADHLPIEDILDDIVAALDREPGVVVQAPPGSGKTTRIPPALLEAPWLGTGRVVVLEPRRVAARAAADFMARARGERVGGTVGYRTRDDTRTSDRTRIEIVTEGVLTRMIQADPSLEGIGAVVFDEFHERSLAADTGLAFALETQSVLRPDLRLVVMSATLEPAPIAALLGAVPVIKTAGRQYPVATRHQARTPATDIEGDVADAVVDVMSATTGDVLVFLPGAGWIRRTERLLEGRLPASTVVTPLFGMLDGEAQDRALRADPAGNRKVVLATSIAETSVTIDGVEVVVDSGLTRVPRFDPASGMTRLETTRVSLATAEQRQGRAGRQGPGVCVRLWSEHDHRHLRAIDEPEIANADLAGLRLELARWGAAEAHELSWLDPPPTAALGEATTLLTLLGALDADGRITAHGRAMADLGAEPRLTHLMLEGHRLGDGALACDIAAILAGRDPLATTDPHDPDIRRRLDLLHDDSSGRARWGALHDARRTARRWRRALDVGDQPGDADRAGAMVSLAYPDRVAAARGPRGSFHLANGKGAELPSTDPLAREPLLAVGTVTTGADARITLAAPIELDELLGAHADQLRRAEVVQWDRRRRDVAAEHQLRLGAAVVQRGPLDDPDRDAVALALLDGVGREGLSLLPWTDDDRRWQARVEFLARHSGDWPDLSDDALLSRIDEWLLPHLRGLRRRRDLDSLDVRSMLAAELGWRRARELDRLAPTHLDVPSGSRIPLDYQSDDTPILAVRLQEMFGCEQTPTVAGVPVILHLLSPAHRPMQVTSDLASFWRQTYPQVRGELAGRYPRHHWPDDPLTAAPTNRAKRRRR
ncbi:MAG: ATP-dependent helicase HrpB [Acidimicrobiia bacterium]|nr:ATP-dependent helicase HrpB [Acidimicrobiia bacterium]